MDDPCHHTVRLNPSVSRTKQPSDRFPKWPSRLAHQEPPVGVPGSAMAARRLPTWCLPRSRPFGLIDGAEPDSCPRHEPCEG
jgi:hypothetical protein